MLMPIGAFIKNCAPTLTGEPSSPGLSIFGLLGLLPEAAQQDTVQGSTVIQHWMCNRLQHGPNRQCFAQMLPAA
jgi:hypothetical protein